MNGMGTARLVGLLGNYAERKRQSCPFKSTTARHPRTLGSSTTFNPTSPAKATVFPNALRET